MVLDHLELDVVLVAHSMGSIGAVNYLARHGTARISQLALAAPTTPLLLKTDDNPDGDKDASAPLALTGAKSARMIFASRLVVIEGAPYALVPTIASGFWLN